MFDYFCILNEKVPILLPTPIIRCFISLGQHGIGVFGHWTVE